MKTFMLFLMILAFSYCIEAQHGNARLQGGPCEGCEAIFEYGSRILANKDTLPGFSSSDNKLKLYGKIFKQDGVTPAEGVILYIYQTDEQGIYRQNKDATGWERRHGSIRGWIKTGVDGKYEFYTFKPGKYPGRNEPAHIHATILEPDGRYYYIDDYLFSDDSSLTEIDRKRKNPRGGNSGIIKPELQDNMASGKRDIILGKNIPGYK